MRQLTFTGERFLAELDDPDIAYEHWHRYLYATQFAAGKQVLDIASGEGYGSALLARHAASVLGVDVAPEAVAAAAARYPGPKLQFKQGSAARIPAEDATFDLVVSFETVEHVDAETQRALVAEVRRVLRPGGLFLVSTPNKLTYSDLPKYSNPFHVHELYPEEFRALLETAFPHVALLSQRNYCGSYLWPAGSAGGAMREYRLERGSTGFRPSDRAKPDRYLVAACSAEPLPDLSPSLMVDLDDRLYRVREQRAGKLERLLQEKDRALRELEAHAAMLEKTILDLDMALRGRPDYARGTASEAAAPMHAAPSTAPGSPAPPVSIVIPVWNKVEYTRGCLEALIRNTPGELFEVILVDNASTDGTAEFLAMLEGDVRVIRNPENVGFVGACNQGAAVARGKYLLFLNNDTSPQEGWLQALVDLAERDAAVGVVGAKLVYPDGKLQEAGGLVFSDASGWNFGRGDNPFDPRYEHPCEVDYCSGAALLVHRDLFEQLGGFDARYAPAYYEDTDLCFGVRSLGRKVMYCPKSIVVHHEGVTAGTDLASGMKRYQVENRAKFAAKWAEALRWQDAPPQRAGAAPATADRARLRRPRLEPAGEGPSVLVVDPFMPLHDRASGSLRLFRLLQLMRERGCRVTYIGRNGNGQERYRRELEAMGIDAYAGDVDRMRECGYQIDAPRVDLPALLRQRRFDVAWLSFWHIGAQYLPLVRLHSPSTRVVLDSVDVHFLRERREAELQGRLAARGAELADRERRELAVYHQADVVVTVTAADGAALRARGLETPLAVVPNVHAPHGQPPPFEARQGLLFVGNFGHAPNVDAIRWFCAEVLSRVRERVPGARLFVVGANPPEPVAALAGPEVVVTGHVPSVDPYLDACRVSIAPLRYGAGMKGKVGEALARGLPVVTTAIGAEGMDLVHREHALVADDAEGFARAVAELYQDPALWARVSAAGQAHVEARYGIAAVDRALAALLEPALRATGTDR